MIQIKATKNVVKKSINPFKNAKKVKRKPDRWREVSKPWKIEIEVVKKKRTEEIQEIKTLGGQSETTDSSIDNRFKRQTQTLKIK